MIAIFLFGGEFMGGKYCLYDRPTAGAAEKEFDLAINKFDSDMEKLADQFKIEYERIAKQFPDVGIGDTVTDDLIARQVGLAVEIKVYNKIH